MRRDPGDALWLTLATGAASAIVIFLVTYVVPQVATVFTGTIDP